YLKHLDDNPSTNDEVGARFDLGDVVREAMERAGLRGHLVRSVIRSEGTRAAAACSRCGARLYVDSAETPPLLEGEVFELDCAGRHLVRDRGRSEGFPVAGGLRDIDWCPVG